LVRFFGEVPLITRIVNAGEVDFPRQPTADIYGQIEQDLTDAIPVLKNVGNVTPEIFEIANENGIESVFEIPHSNESNWFDWGYIIGGDGNFSIIHNGVRGLSGGDNPFDAGWSFNVPTPEYVASFEADDPRKDASIIFEEDLIAGGSSIIEGFQHTGYYNKKYTPRKGESCCQRELNYGNNNRVIRFADVLLMGAEAHARGGGSEGVAQQYLNRVRRRAFGDTNHDITSTGPALIQAIWDERMYELGGEGHRFYDLVRTGEASTVLGPLGFESKHQVFPIPQQEINLTNGILTQNPGY